jgi:lipopolysaccharide heptosyltransferase II
MRALLKPVVLTIREALLRLMAPLLFRARREFFGEHIDRILVIRIDGIGDLVLSLPAIRALRQRFPSAHITVMASKANGDLIREAADINEMIIYRKGMDLKSLGFDLVFDFLDNYALKTARLAYSIKARYRVGFDIKGRGVFFNVKARQPDAHRHYVDAMLDLVALVGAETDNRFPELKVPSAAGDEAVQFLASHEIREGDRIVCIHPGAKHWTGRWLPERFARLADELARTQSAKVIFLGGPDDDPQINQIKTMVKEKALFYTGRPLQSVAALISRSRLLICNNSGLLHVACALNIPTVSTMGPTLPKKWWPVGPGNIVLRQDLPCIGCGKGYCRIITHDCMRKISVEDMLEAVRSQLQQGVL